MLAPATLALGPCAAPSALNLANRAFSPNIPPPRPLDPRRIRGLTPHSLPLPLRRNPSLPITRAVAVDTNQPGSAPPEQEQDGPRRYYFVVANAKFMLDDEEHFQEQLYERLRLFAERNREQDFWLVVEPKFLDKFPSIAKRLRRPAVALVSTDARWITFMKLRLDRVLSDNFEADSVEEALASDPVDLHFEKPEKWVAPYPKYESGWWKPFLLPETSKTAA